jgi:hypothetical protein
MSTSKARAIREFSKWAKNRFGGDLLSMVIFGSVAKGADEEGSDVDVLLIVRKGLPMKEQIRIFEPITLKLLRRYFVRMSPMLIGKEGFEKMVEVRSPLLLGVLEGYEVLYDWEKYFEEKMAVLKRFLSRATFIEEGVWYSPELEVG